MSAHTPGPWTYEPIGRVHTKATQVFVWGPEHQVIIAQASPTINEADFHLIAAAPDGYTAADEALAALYGCREVLGSIANVQHAIDLLEAYKKKAEGSK